MWWTRICLSRNGETKGGKRSKTEETKTKWQKNRELKKELSKWWIHWCTTSKLLLDKHTDEIYFAVFRNFFLFPLSISASVVCVRVFLIGQTNLFDISQFALLFYALFPVLLHPFVPPLFFYLKSDGYTQLTHTKEFNDSIELWDRKKK